MNYLPAIDEDDGFCPRCQSSDTVLIRAKAKRACLACEFSEEFEDTTQALHAWQTKQPGQAKTASSAKTQGSKKSIEPKPAVKEPKQVEKFIEVVEPEITKITIPTLYRDDFNQYLASRKIDLVGPCKTDVWNNVESAYTVFELGVRRQIAESIFDDWANN